ncbi:MAG: LURP-one-related family protein [Oscillospiraceae bacterium]|jgi:uncharacterized protein YxjI|nr:LURP-one-related family protein [Oscillospiraceae bacterium]
MNLYIKQKALSWRCRFGVMDSAGNNRWFAEGEVFSFTHKLHVYDAQGNEVALIYRKNWTLFERQYHIELGGGQHFMLVKELTFFKSKFRLEGLPWRMDGDFFSHDYSLYDQQREIMHITKQWLTWGDTYSIEIPDPSNELLCLCIVLAVDSMVEDAASN